METPYGGRAIINDDFDRTEIIIPGKKNYGILLFLCVWMAGWFFGETSVLATLGKNGASDLFLMVWLAGWTVGGIFAARTLLFMLLGKEIVKVGLGIISIRNKALFLKSPKIFDLNEVKHIRAEEEFSMYSGFQNRQRRRGGFYNLDSGTIRFDYGLKTVKFGNDLDEAEARYIIEILKKKRLLTDKNF